MDLPPPLTHRSFANITHKIENVSEEVVHVEPKREAATTKELCQTLMDIVIVSMKIGIKPNVV